MKTKKIDYFDFINKNLINCDISYRGGSMKIDVSDLFNTGNESAIMGAYQNYLGGGIAGSIQTGRMFDISGFSEEDLNIYEELEEACKRWFYDQNNGGVDQQMRNHGWIVSKSGDFCYRACQEASHVLRGQKK